MRNPTNTVHQPVMKNEVVYYLRACQGGEFLDCTLGGGGHTRAILEANSANRVLAADRDQQALDRAVGWVGGFEGRLELVRARFSELGRKIGGRKFNGVLADLGVSSDQLQEHRGFSFNDDCALDMRMEPSAPKSAYEIVNHTGPKELYAILRRGGVGPEARVVVSALIAARPIHTTARLAQVVRGAVTGRGSPKRIDPATLTFQAIRIAVNDELEELEALLDLAPKIVCHQGRLVILTFHSLEDKAVTSRMRLWQGGENLPALWPGARASATLGRMPERKAIRPQERELEHNPRARSARLRVFEFEQN